MPRTYRRAVDAGRVKQNSRIQRIVLGQNPERPIVVRRRSVIRRSALKDNPSWWILHRRGFRRPRVGVDPLEARAVAKDMIKGTLPERIVYRWLINHYFVPNVDFDFQSSLEGGRLELGGIVVDYMFTYHKLIIQVDGPTHFQHGRGRKDDEQRMILEAMGYRVEALAMDLIYDEPRFEDEMRRIFRLGYYGRGQVYSGQTMGETIDPESQQLAVLGTRVDRLFLRVQDYVLSQQ